MSAARILIVEDRPEHRDLLHDPLVDEGYDPLLAADSAAAQGYLDDPGCDLVLLDLQLTRGGNEGLELLQHIRSIPSLQRLPVIVVSVAHETATIVKCLQMGADDYLEKPFAPEELKARVHTHLDRYRLLRELEQERETTRKILNDILPGQIAEQLISKKKPQPDIYRHVAVLFADVCRFTAASEQRSARQTFHSLARLFVEFEAFARARRVEKIRTIGDGFLATVNLLRKVDRPVRVAIEFGKDIILEAKRQQTEVRVGIAFGDVVAGLVGEDRYHFDVMGHTANLASRVEGVAAPSSICLSGKAYREVTDDFPGIKPILRELKNVTGLTLEEVKRDYPELEAEFQELMKKGVDVSLIPVYPLPLSVLSGDAQR